MFRSTFDSYINDLPPGQFKVAVLLFSMAATRPKRRRVGGEMIELQPGQLATSVRDLASRANVSRGVVERALCNLEQGRTIDVTARRGGTLVTLVHYNEFRLDGHARRDSSETVTGRKENEKNGETVTGRGTASKHEDIPDPSASCRDTDEPCGGTPSGTPPTPPYKEVRSKEVERGKQRSLSLAVELWDEFNAARNACSDFDRGVRNLGWAPGREAPIAKLLGTWSADEIRHAIACHAAEARAIGSARYFDGIRNFTDDAIRRTAGRTVEDFAAEAKRRHSDAKGDEPTPRRIARLG